MIEELSASSGMTVWAVGSMLFFVAVYVLIVIRTMRARREDMRRAASLPLDGDETRGEHG